MLYSELYSDKKPRPELIYINADSIDANTSFNHKDTALIVAIGSKALSHVLKSNTSVPLLCVLSRKNIVHSLLKEHHRQIGSLRFLIGSLIGSLPSTQRLNEFTGREPVGQPTFLII